MKKIYFFVMALAVCLAGTSQVVINSLGTANTENFNTLAASGTSSTLPTGWLLSKSSNTTTYTASNGGTSNNFSGDVYSFGSTGSSERAFGSVRSNSTVPTIGVSYKNNTGSTITSISISYTGEQWRLGTAGRADRLDFQYSTTATGIGSGTYTTVGNLSFSSPVTSGNIGGLDGNISPNKTAISFTISNLSIADGSTFYFRWIDIDATSADDGLAIDDFSATFNGATQAACTAPTAQPSAITFSNVTSTTFDAGFTAANPTANEYLALISTSNTLSANPADGTVYNVDDAVGNAVVAYRGSGTTFSEADLTPNTTYYLYVFALNSANCSGGPVYNTTSPATSSQSTAPLQACTAPVNQVSNITFSSTSSTSISGNYTAASDAGGYLVIISTNAMLGFTPTNGTTYPAGSAAGNGTVIKNSAGTTFSASSLSANTTYYFSFFSLNNTGCSGGPAYNTTPVNASTQTNSNNTGIPTGYYDAITSQTCATLKTALKNRTASGNTPRNYSALWTQYLVSDVKPREVGSGSANVIWDVYSDNPNGTDPYNFTPGSGSGGQQDGGGAANSEGILYNREHSVPLSWFNGSTGNDGPATDYLHLYPTDKYVNAQRGSFIYGEITNPTNVYRNGSKLGPNTYAGLNGTCFEPTDAYKGDLARSFLYFVTRYEDLMPGTPTNSNGTQAFEQNTYPSVDNPYLNLMIKWHNQDPVSQKEIDRNNAAYSFQGNRNPYIDHPEYVDKVWNSGCSGVIILPVDLASFRGTLLGSNVLLQWDVKTETNLQQYVVERSDNGRTFSTIGYVQATHQPAYQYNDDITNLTGRRLYYRLKKVDKDGKYAYSEVFNLHIPAKLSFTVYPNPVTNGLLHIQLAKPATTNSQLTVLDAAGKIIQQLAISRGTTQLSMPLKAAAKGTYFVKLTAQDGIISVQKIQVQ